MENELPILGEIYQHKTYVGQRCKIIAITDNRVVYEMLNENGENIVNSYHKSKVWVFLKRNRNKELLGLSMKYKIGNVEVEAVREDGGNYRVQTELGSVFWIIEQDFNNMATKIKEPKFKVGDTAYFIECGGGDFHCSSVQILSSEYSDELNGSYHFYTTRLDFDEVFESDLFTLEEAIEKLKEL
jgi:hypothetical protein